MAKDYKKRPRAGSGTRAKPKRRGVPAWIGLVAGLGIGLGVAYAVHLHHTAGLPSGLAAAALASAKSGPHHVPPAGSSDRKSGGPSGTRFEFYSLLPEMEVVVPEAELGAGSSKPRPAPQRRPASATDGAAGAASRYVLQAGAFRSLQDADRLRASLALAGLEAAIQTVAVDGRSTWHRVRLGPFTDLGELREVRRRLRAVGVDPMILRIRT